MGIKNVLEWMDAIEKKANPPQSKACTRTSHSEDGGN